jgi:hypothetical protein
MKTLLEVHWSKSILGLESKQEDFVFYALGHRKPVQVDQNWGDVFPGGNTSDDPRCRVLHALELFDDSLRRSIKECVGVIQA